MQPCCVFRNLRGQDIQQTTILKSGTCVFVQLKKHFLYAVSEELVCK